MDATSYIDEVARAIAEFPGTGPESLDAGTPVAKRTRRSTMYVVFSFSADPGNWSIGLSVSLDGVNYVVLDTVTGTDGTPVLKKYEKFPWNFIQPFQNSKVNDVVATITAKLV